MGLLIKNLIIYLLRHKGSTW